MSSFAKRLAKRFKREHRPKEQKSTPDQQKATPDQFLFKDGNPMAILRPRAEDVAEKLRLFSEIPPGLPPDVYNAYCDEIICDKLPHRFIGYALKDGRIVECDGKPVSRIQPGDSFVSPNDALKLPDFMTTGRMHDEVWDGRRVLVLPRPDLRADSNTGIVLESPDPTEKASIILRAGAPEIDCHIPTLNEIWTGDRNRDWRTMGNRVRTDPPSTSAALSDQHDPQAAEPAKPKKEDV